MNFMNRSDFKNATMSRTFLVCFTSSYGDWLGKVALPLRECGDRHHNRATKPPEKSMNCIPTRLLLETHITLHPHQTRCGNETDRFESPLFQGGAGFLNARAGLFQDFFGRRIGNPERRAKAEGPAVDCCDLGFVEEISN